MGEKKLPQSSETKRTLIEGNHPVLSVRRQCELIGLNRATFSRQPSGETRLNVRLMRLLDEAYTRTPFYGYCKMTIWLNTQGYRINRKRVARRMGTMELHAIYPQPRTSVANREYKKYPYLQHDVEIARPNQV